MLKKIGSTARYEIERLLGCKVNLKLWVKVQKNWRDSDYLMKNFGYREDGSKYQRSGDRIEKFSIIKNGIFIQYDASFLSETILKDHGKKLEQMKEE